MSAHQSTERLAYSVDEAASLIGVSRSTLYQLLATGELEVVRIGRRTLVPRHVLAKMLGARPEELAVPVAHSTAVATNLSQVGPMLQEGSYVVTVRRLSAQESQALVRERPARSL